MDPISPERKWGLCNVREGKRFFAAVCIYAILREN